MRRSATETHNPAPGVAATVEVYEHGGGFMVTIEDENGMRCEFDDEEFDAVVAALSDYERTVKREQPDGRAAAETGASVMSAEDVAAIEANYAASCAAH